MKEYQPQQPGESGYVRLVAVDDDPQVLRLVTSLLEQDGLEILTATDPEEAWTLIRRTHPEIVIVDLMMPRLNGMQLLERIVEWDQRTDVILLTAEYSPEYAVEAIQKGACDYLTKPISVPRLRERVGRLLSSALQRRMALKLEKQLLNTSRFEEMVGRSPRMLELFAQIRRIAPHYRTVLITGASGTGKELVAKSLHNLSPVSRSRFVVCNCSSIAETLFESELFGSVKGAYTGAVQNRMGMFEYADGGTLFLDEIGELPLAVQSKLLRVLQNQEVQRVGSPAVKRVEVRVVAATNRDLRAMAETGQFRADLFYRLSMVELAVPRLAERKDDLRMLTLHFVEHFSKRYQKPIKGISRRAQALIYRFSWPGNIRELENVIGRAAMLTEGDVIDVHDLPEYLRKRAPEGPAEGDLLPLAEVERRHAQFVLERLEGNKAQAAEVLGVSRTTLYRILNEPSAYAGGES